MSWMHACVRGWLGRALALTVAWMLAGCATTTMAPPLAQGGAAADQGVVLLSITGNTARIGQIDSVSLLRLGSDAVTNTQVLRNVATGLARDTALFVGVVPPGEYALARLSIGERFIGLGAGSQNTLGTIRVQAGQVADLGRVIVTPLNTRVLTGRSGLETSNVQLIQRFSPENAANLKGTIVGGWNRPRDEKDRVEEYALAAPVGADTPLELPNGDVAAASRLGTVLLRNGEGRWRAVRTGRLESLLAVAAAPGARVDGVEATLVAVGEFNTIARLEAGGKLALLDPGNLPPGNLLGVAGDSGAGWYVAHQSRTRVTLMHSPTLDRGTWTALRTEDIAFSFWSGANSLWMWRTARGFAYAVSEGKLAYFDFATRNWTERRAPGNARILVLAPSAGEALGIVTSPGGGLGGVFATMYLSRDAAASWTEVKSPFSVKVFAPRVLPDSTILVGGGVFSKPELQASKDGGATWTLVSDKFDLQDNITVLPTRGLLAVDAGAQFGLARIRHSADGGATWRVELSNFDRAFYDAEQKRREAPK